LNPEPLNLCDNNDRFDVIELEDQVVSGFGTKERRGGGYIECHQYIPLDTRYIESLINYG
jgi:hypothetical protein